MSQRLSTIFCAAGAWGGKPIGRVRVNRYRRKRSKVDASIFDSVLSHTRRSDTSEKKTKIARPLLDVFACGQVSSPRLYRFHENRVFQIFCIVISETWPCPAVMGESQGFVIEKNWDGEKLRARPQDRDRRPRLITLKPSASSNSTITVISKSLRLRTP